MKHGAAVKLRDCFLSRKKEFREATLLIYGKKTVVTYLELDLLWGQSLYQPLRFVLVQQHGIHSILVSTDRSLSGEQIILLYSKRFKIESCFRERKQVLGLFRSHFWTKSMPRRNRFQKKEEDDPLKFVQSKKQRKRILLTVKATEGFVLYMSITMGLLQILSLHYPSEKTQTIGELLEEARRKSGAKKLTSHDIMALERFDPDTRHMIVLDVLSHETPNGHSCDWRIAHLAFTFESRVTYCPSLCTSNVGW